MTAHGEWALTRRIRINARLSCDLSIGPNGACYEWIGGSPRGLTAFEQRRYRNGRDQLLQQVASRLGGNVLLVEV